MSVTSWLRGHLNEQQPAKALKSVLAVIEEDKMEHIDGGAWPYEILDAESLTTKVQAMLDEAGGAKVASGIDRDMNNWGPGEQDESNE